MIIILGAIPYQQAASDLNSNKYSLSYQTKLERLHAKLFTVLFLAGKEGRQAKLGAIFTFASATATCRETWRHCHSIFSLPGATIDFVIA